ncbi:conjugal transfer protein TraG N-terminal domain-containing protein [Motilimonas cestriensis]|uniref:conjugal transfer protein TraG N-terminal domain-containing protein n=1 Tax=Motilimonas cestriensis TaxID=2742685 RepID=UPI003DA33C01
MSIPVHDISEMYSIVIGNQIAADIFTLLTNVGIVYVPFIYMIVKSWLEARASGSDEGSPAIVGLKKIEHNLYIMIFVYIFAVVPVNFSGAGVAVKSYKFGCDADNGKEEGFSHNPSGAVLDADGLQTSALAAAGFTSTDVRMPLWWAMVQTLTVSTSNAVVANIPCNINMRNFAKEAQQDIITDSTARDTITPFLNSCVADAKKRVKALYPDADTSKSNTLEYLSVNSSYMIEAYKNVPMTINNKLVNKNGASYPVPWASVTGDDVKVSCHDVYMGNSTTNPNMAGFVGVKNIANRALTTEELNGYASILQVDPSETDIITNGLIEQRLANTELDINGSSWGSIMGNVASGMWDNTTNALTYTPIGASIASGKTAINVLSGETSVLENSPLAKTAVLAGTFMSEIGARVDIIGLKAAQPIILSIITTVYLLALPILLTITGFSGKSLLSLSGFYFALKFTPVIFAVGEWFDKVMIQAMQSEFSSYNMDSAMFKAMGDYVALAAYQYMPMLWFAIVGIVGIQGAAAQQHMGGNVSQSASQQGQKGVQAAGRGAKAVATKGKSEGVKK